VNFQELIRARYSVRAYKPDPVEDEKLERVLEAFRLAPTACNLQPFKVVVVRTKGREEELRRIYKRDWFVQPPYVAAVCSIPKESWVRKWDGWNSHEVDATIAMDHLIPVRFRQSVADGLERDFHRHADGGVHAVERTGTQEG